MKTAILLASGLIASATCWSLEPVPLLIPSSRVLERVDDWAIVEDVVTEASKSERGSIFLNFGGRHPDQIFTAYVAPFLVQLTGEQVWLAMEGKRVRVDGMVKLHKGRPEIKVIGANFVTVVK